MKTLNRALLAASAALCALAPTVRAHADALSPEDVRHALTRTSFAASPSDLRTFTGQTRAALIESILDDINALDTQPAQGSPSNGAHRLSSSLARTTPWASWPWARSTSTSWI